MTFQKYEPGFPLNNYIDSILFIEGNNKGTGLPKMAMSLVFNLEDNFKLYTDKTFTNHIDYRKYWIAGLQTKPTSVESYGLSKMLVVQFHTLGAFVFLNEPLHYYSNKYVTLDCIFNREAEETWEQLQEGRSINEKFLIIENYFYRKLLSNKIPDKKYFAIFRSLFASKNNLSVNEICKQQNISRKHLNHLTKKYIGVSPKTFTSLVRLQSTLKTMGSSTFDNLTDVAYESNYFDQAHFINDFKKYTDLKPSEYAKLVEKNPSMKIAPHLIPFKSMSK